VHEPQRAATGAPATTEVVGDATDVAVEGTGTGPGVAVIRSPRERALRIAGYVGLAVVLIGVVLGARAVLTSDGPPAPEVTVPDVTGVTLEEAVAALGAVDLRVGRITEVETEASPPGTVLIQLPGAGSRLAVGGSVDVSVARSPALTTVPNVAGLSENEALRRLRDAGLVPGTRVRAASDTLPSGTVVGTQPGPGTRVAVDTVVEVTISDGPALARVLDVTRRPLAEAVARLRDRGFVVDVNEERSPAVAAGLVIRQVPEGGHEDVLGSTVMLWVSTGIDGTAPVPVVPDPDPTDPTDPDGDEAREDDEDAGEG
jgi:serine/threonine-protein kinase